MTTWSDKSNILVIPLLYLCWASHGEVGLSHDHLPSIFSPSPKQQITSCYFLFGPAIGCLGFDLTILASFSLFALEILKTLTWAVLLLIFQKNSISEVKWVLLGRMRCLRVWIFSPMLGFRWFSKFVFSQQLTSSYWGRLEARRPNRLWRHQSRYVCLAQPAICFPPNKCIYVNVFTNMKEKIYFFQSTLCCLFTTGLLVWHANTLYAKTRCSANFYFTHLTLCFFYCIDANIRWSYSSLTKKGYTQSIQFISDPVGFQMFTFL